MKAIQIEFMQKYAVFKLECPQVLAETHPGVKILGT